MEYDEEILEKCLPKYLERFNCLYNELQGSINSAFIEGEITKKQCDYLYEKKIYMEVENKL